MAAGCKVGMVSLGEKKERGLLARDGTQTGSPPLASGILSRVTPEEALARLAYFFVQFNYSGRPWGHKACWEIVSNIEFISHSLLPLQF